MNLRYHSLYILICVTLSLTNCAPLHTLQRNESLLVRQDIMGNKQVATADLEPYYLADTNRKIVNIPVWLYLYFLGEYYFNKPFIEQSYHKVTRTYDKQLAAAINNPKKYQRLEAAKKQKLQHYENLLAQGNLLMQLGEAPCLYSAEKRKQTERNMLQYLYTQGFFNAHLQGNYYPWVHPVEASLTLHI